MFLFLFSLLICSGDGTFQGYHEQSKTELLGDWLYELPQKLVVDPGGNRWFLLVFGSKIFKVSPTGEMLLDLAPQGQGPGEIEMPLDISLIEGGRYLLVTQMNGKWHLFESGTGKFVQTIGRPCPSGNIIPWDTESFVAVNCGTQTGRTLWFHRFKNNGDLISEGLALKWWQDYRADKNGVLAEALLGVVHNDLLYFGDYFMSELWVYDGIRPPKLWKLPFPRHYRQVPDKQMPEKDRWSREKSLAWSRSFTHFTQTLVVSEDYLVVQWSIDDPYPYSVDIFDLRSRKALIRNVKTNGHLYASSGNKLFFIEEKEADSLDGSDQYFLTEVTLTLP